MGEDEPKTPGERVAAAIDESDGQVELTWFFTKNSYWGKHVPGGLQISMPWWAVVGGGALGGTALLAMLLNHLGKLDKYKPSKSQESEYGPNRVTLADLDYARSELGPIVTPMEWLVGVPLYARAHRDYRMELAAEVAAPTDAGVSDKVLGYSDLANWTFVKFTLSSGEQYVTIFIPANKVDEFPGGHTQEYWLLTDGSQNTISNMNTAGTVANKLYTQAKQEGLWPPRKLTADEKEYGNAGPPADESA